MFWNRILRTLLKTEITHYPLLKLSSGKTNQKTLTAFAFNLIQSALRRSWNSLNRTRAPILLLLANSKRRSKLLRRKLTRITSILKLSKTCSTIYPTALKNYLRLLNSLYQSCTPFSWSGTILRTTTHPLALLFWSDKSVTLLLNSADPQLTVLKSSN